MKTKNKGINIFIILLMIVFFNILAVIWFNNMVFEELEASAKSSLQEMASEQSKAISLIIENKRDNVIGIVDTIRFIGNDIETLYNSMDLWEKEFEIETIILTDLNGNGIVSNGGTANIADRDYFHPAAAGEIVLSNAYDSSHTGNRVLALAAPIYYNGSVSGVIVTEYNVLALAELLIGSTDSRGSAMIVNSEGNILVHTYPFPISFENFQGAEFEGGKTYQDILDDFSNSNAGDVIFSIAGDRKLGEYIPLGVEDWTLFFEISETALSDSGNTITTGMLIISASLLSAFLILIIYILIVRRRSLQNIEQVAFYDELTGVSNLVKFKMDLSEIISRKDFDTSKYILLKGDIENFKVINEVFGMEIGDRVICQVANIIQSMEGEVFEIARTGSDEFLILAEKDKVEHFFANREFFVDKLKAAVPEIRKHILSYRYGRYFLEPSETNVDDMINKVSIAHSYARTGVGMSVWDYDIKFKNHMLRMTELTNKMEDALANKEFKMFLQPKYNVRTNQIVGAEALVRWFEEDGGVVYPNDFIPLFEKNGFITSLDEFIFASACEYISERLQNDENCVPISVNFSRRHLKNPEFVNRLQSITKLYNTPTNYLEIELTETAVIENIDVLNEVLDQLHSAGFIVAIDDFGSGYSALGMLKEYKFDIVKLDRSFFICPEEYRENAKTVITGIINLVTSLGSRIIAEGVEYVDQVEFLRTVNCDSVQGYYFSKPINSNEFKKLLDSQN